MGRKKRRSSKYRDSSTVIDMDQARQARQQERLKKKKRKRNTDGRAKAGRTAVKDATAAAAASMQDMADQLRGENPQEEGMSREGQVRQDRRRMALRKRKRNRNLIIIGVLAGLLVMVSFSVGNILLLKHDLHVAKKQQEAYQEEKTQLEEDLKEYEDYEFLEEQARNQMRLVMPGETLYIFPEDMTSTPPQQDEEDVDTKTKEEAKKDKDSKENKDSKDKKDRN